MNELQAGSTIYIPIFLKGGLVWTGESGTPGRQAVVASDAAWVYPEPAELDRLEQAARIGYVRGVLQALDAIESAQPACAAYTQSLRILAHQYQFETLLRRMRPIPS